ncbi:hypothetical protein Taro_013286 [Colocasia esculenta]|uniref:Uncharacterized protein n=1 Tax=Colocasia esculenta TaxID=4460 RepID=A0A843UB54_COLES|nr:hypothetical protein [Colocasia esculenta]
MKQMAEEDGHPAASEGQEEDAADDVGGRLYPVYFGASCAFLTLHLLSGRRGPDLNDGRRWCLEEALLQGGARLLGLLVWRVQRGGEALEEGLRRAESEVAELKRLRAEDARANEKVVGIFAAHEQSWIAERKKMRLQTQALLTQFQMLEAKREATMAETNGKVEEKERVIRSKEEALEEAAKRTTELEEMLRTAEAASEEAREEAKKEAQDHAAELWKHKTTFVELVSSQRQLEADMGRALRQAEAARRELEEAREQREEAAEAAERMADELARTRKDAEQKDKILSAMLRKSKLDTSEKQMLLKDLKLAKARKKQAELEVERLQGFCGQRHRKGLRGHLPLVAESSEEEQSSSFKRGRAGFHSRTLLLDYLEAESTNDNSECGTPEEGDAVSGSDSVRRYSSKDGEEELVTADIRHLQDWVRTETEKYASVLQQRHYAEVTAFTEQMRLKDEKLEAYRWRLLSMELEAKRLQSHIKGLDGNVSKLRKESVRLEALLMGKERELRALQEQFELHLHRCRKSVVEKTPELEIPSAGGSPEVDSETTQRGGGCDDAIDEVKNVQFVTQIIEKEPNHEGETEPELASSAASPSYSGQLEQGTFLSSQSPVEEIEEEKEVGVDPGHALLKPRFPESSAASVSPVQVSGPSSVCDNSPWKMDLHALGISYKIKRLKQQLLVLEKLAAAQALKQLPGKEDKRDANEHKQQFKGLLLVMSLLNKQVKRYQSLEEKADDLCKRMHEIDREGRSRGSCQGRAKEQTEALEGFLEETFQLQRYVVATGQKLMEIQTRISSSFGGGSDSDGGWKENPEFNLGRFAAIVRGLFREIQRGLEVRIARIIGNLEGTLASDGFLHMRN